MLAAVGRLRRRAGQLRYELRLWRDLRHVDPLPDRLAATYEDWWRLQRELDPAYERYITHVSRSNWAASPQLAALLWHLCRVTRPKRILELGTGFTSYVFRRYAEEGGDVAVVSADTSEEWLTKTRAFLGAMGCRDDGLVLLDDLGAEAADGTFELILNDVLGDIRPWMTTVALRYRSEDGLIVMDDADRDVDRRSLIRNARENGLSLYDLRPWTLDFYGRWSLLAAN
jgi:predicted O-methyltransferase YrrM